MSFLKFFQQVCENNEYKNKVLTTLSHELRTPLNGALIPLEKLRNESLEKNTTGRNDGLDIAYKSMVLLQNVLNDVVDFALINTNQLYLNYDELDLYKFLDNIVDLFRTQAQEKGLEMQLIYDQMNKIPRILKTDFQRLGQILVSLLNNSLKNTFQGGIALHVDIIEKSIVDKTDHNIMKNYLKILVVDTGVGIEEDKLQNIKKCLKTKDMIQVCESLNKKHGCGLGLIISHCLALLLGPPDSNGLHVNCKSQRGTEFRFYLEVFQEKVEENLMIIEEKTKDFSNFTPTYKTSTQNNKTYNSVFGNSFYDYHLKKKDRAQTNVREDIVDSECSREKKLIESERSPQNEFTNFLHSHTLQPKNMVEITGNFNEVLIVDDDSFNLMALEAILSKFNMKSVRAFNGQQAIDKIFERHREFPKSQVFSMAFLDYHMPVKDGLETTKEIVEMFREEGLIEFPIIACTAFGARDLVKNWTFFGVSDFVIKPVGFQKIEGILRKFNVLK